MSKSLGNFFTLRDLLQKGFEGREIRYLLLSAHYRETFNFTVEGLESARSALGRIDECLNRLGEVAGPVQAAPAPALVQRVSEAVDDDLNVSAAWGGAVFEWVRETNRQLAARQLGPPEAAAALAAWETSNSVFGLSPRPGAAIPDQVLALVQARQAARKTRDFKRADAMRDELKAKGWVIEDTPQGPRPKPS